MAPMRRGLLNVISVASLVVCVVTCVSWVASYWDGVGTLDGNVVLTQTDSGFRKLLMPGRPESDVLMFLDQGGIADVSWKCVGFRYAHGTVKTA